jgi:hypothetical protein
MELKFENLPVTQGCVVTQKPPSFAELELFSVESGDHDGLSEDRNSPRAIAFRQRTSDFQASYEKSLESGDLTPAPYSYKHYFTEKHSEFGVALYGREMSVGKGAIIIGKIHKHPVINVLLKGKLLVVSESGRRTVEAPCAYVSEPGIKKIGYVLEDCVWLNVLMTDEVGEENLDSIISKHTAENYAELGLIDLTQKD